MNVVPLRVLLDDGLGFRTLLRRVQETVLDAYELGDVPFERLVERLGLAHDASRTPLVQALFGFEARAGERWELEGLSVSEERPPVVSAKYDLTLTAAETDA